MMTFLLPAIDVRDHFHEMQDASKDLTTKEKLLGM